MLHNINLYKNEVTVVYVIDNSETYSPQLEAKVRALGNATYLHNRGNLGVAKALNIAAENAAKDGYHFLLTMDQDSKVQPGMIQTMLDCVTGMNFGEIGIISPTHVYAHSRRGDSGRLCDEALTVMTSGNLLNLKVYQAVGSFLNDFFIDHVDDEYCLRLRLRGLRVIRANNALLEHPLGAITEHRFFFKKFALSNHAPVRRYYGIRNKFCLRKLYARYCPSYFRFFYWKIFREMAVILFYESDRFKKIFMMAKGYLDFRNGVTGAYPEIQEGP